MCTHLAEVLHPLCCRIGHFIVVYQKVMESSCSGCVNVKRRRVLPKRPAEVSSGCFYSRPHVPTVTGVIVGVWLFLFV